MTFDYFHTCIQELWTVVLHVDWLSDWILIQFNTFKISDAVDIEL
jgi:hypothetical protein